jgi:hypothetical protein
MADIVSGGTIVNYQAPAKAPKYHSIRDKDFRANLSEKIKENHGVSPLDKKSHHKINQDGIEIARQKEMKNFSIAIEKALLSKMWQGVFSSVTHEHEETKTISDFHSSIQVDAMVGEMFGEEGGPVADAIYEKLINEYEQNKKRGLDVKRSYNKNH